MFGQHLSPDDRPTLLLSILRNFNLVYGREICHTTECYRINKYCIILSLLLCAFQYIIFKNVDNDMTSSNAVTCRCLLPLVKNYSKQ